MWNHQIFKQIVQNDDDFVGMVAYSLYKQEKIRWIQRQKEQTGTFPDRDTLDRYFHDFAATEEVLERYRQQAEERVNRFVQLSTLTELEDYKKQVRDEQIITSIENRLYKGWLRSIGETPDKGQ